MSTKVNAKHHMNKKYFIFYDDAMSFYHKMVRSERNPRFEHEYNGYRVLFER